MSAKGTQGGQGVLGGGPGGTGGMGGPGGGTGGTGGTGGAGSRSPSHRALIAAFLILWLGSVAVVALQQLHLEKNSTKINALVRAEHIRVVYDEDVTQQQVKLIRQTAYRLCVRAQEGRTILILLATRSDVQISHLLRVAPLYNCAPDLNGGVARKLSAREALAKIRAFAPRFNAAVE